MIAGMPPATDACAELSETLAHFSRQVQQLGAGFGNHEACSAVTTDFPAPSALRIHSSCRVEACRLTPRRRRLRPDSNISSGFSVHTMLFGNESVLFRAMLRLQMCVRGRGTLRIPGKDFRDRAADGAEADQSYFEARAWRGARLWVRRLPVSLVSEERLCATDRSPRSEI